MAIAVAVSLFTVCRGGEEVSINRLRRVTIGGSRNYQLQLSLLCKQFSLHTRLIQTRSTAASCAKPVSRAKFVGINA